MHVRVRFGTYDPARLKMKRLLESFMATIAQWVERTFKSGKNKDLADAPPALCFAFLSVLWRCVSFSFLALL